MSRSRWSSVQTDLQKMCVDGEKPPFNPRTHTDEHTKRTVDSAVPKGKVWCEGAWVDARRARKAPSPGTDLTLKVRPIGRLPKGKRWDPVGGCLVSAGGGRFKRKAAVEAPRDENAAPQRQRRSQRV